MDIDQYNEIERVFVEVVDLPMDERGERIRELCADADLVTAVEELIAEHERLLVDGFMEVGVLGDGLDWETTEASVPCPSEIHGYRILKQLGRGASGTVYLAQSPAPLERLIALKLIHSGAGKMTMARFREEQRALARMQHVGIAEVYDEGVTEDGRAFTVLEYIEGESITAYCRSMSLDWRAVFGLMIQCCEAVSHAHQRNIIHRDLKPSNLMVADTGGVGRVKVIDFGTAKLVDPYLMMTQLTLDTQFIGTLPYTSPEQLSGSEASDTRTDVYALGIVLYECLVGRHPYFGDEVGLKAAIDLIMTAPIPAIKGRAGVPVREFGAILSRACAKEPGERYPSLVHMGEDLRHLLDGLPVVAMRTQPMYVARKFVVRHRVAMGIASVVFAVVVFMGGLAVERGIVAAKHRNAMRGTAIGMVDDLMPMLADLSGSGEARHELAWSLGERIDELLLTDADDGELLLRKARVLEYKSDMLLAEELVDGAERHRVEAHGIIQRLKVSGTAGSESLLIDERRLIIKLGDIAKARMDFDGALGYYEKNHRLLLAADGDHREGLCWSFERLLWVARKQHRADDTVGYAHDRLALALELSGESPDSIESAYNCARAYQDLAEVSISTGEYEEAIEYSRQSVEHSSAFVRLDPDGYLSHEMELNAATALARALCHSGQFEEAEAQADVVCALAVGLALDNPGRKIVREFTWMKISSLRDLWSQVDPERNMKKLDDEMQKLVPEKLID